MLSAEERSGLVFTLVGGAVLVVVLLLLLGVFSDAPPAESSRPAQAASVPALKLGAVRGRVVDGRSGFGLASRAIEVRGLPGLSDHWLLEPDAASPGGFEVRGLPARSCKLALQADGYVEATRDLEIVAGRTLELGDVALVPLVSLVGQVRDASGTGLGPAQLQIESKEAPPQTIETDAHGAFRVDRLAPGAYRLRATTREGDASFVDALVDGAAGGEQGGLVIEVFPTVAARGALRMPIGSALPVYVEAQGRRSPVRGDGSFELAGLHAGPARLLVALDGERAVAFDVSLPADPLELTIDPAAAAPTATLAATASDDLARLEPDLGGTTALIVRTVDGEGRRLAGARVELVDESSGRRERLRFTNRAGECALRGLASDRRWKLRAVFGPLSVEQPLELDAASTRESVLTLAAPAPAAPAEAPASGR